MTTVACKDCGKVLVELAAGRLVHHGGTYRVSRRSIDGSPLRGHWTDRAKDKPLCRSCADERVAALR